MRHSVGQTRNGLLVVVDLICSPAAKHIAQQPHLLGYAKEILQQKALRNATATIEYDMGRVIGYSPTTHTTNDDTIFYAQLMRDDTYTRFVKKTSSQSTQYVTLILRRASDNAYEIEDIWIGRFYPPRPGTLDETAMSKPYWTDHAFIFDNQPIQLRSVTKVVPY